MRGSDALVVLLACACTPTVSTHAAIAQAAYAPISAAKAAIETTAFNDAARIRVEARTPDEVDRQITLLRVRYAPLKSAMSALILAYDAYVDAIRGASDGGDDAQTEAARVLVFHWHDLQRAARAHGLTVPPPPPELVGLVRSTQ